MRFGPNSGDGGGRMVPRMPIGKRCVTHRFADMAGAPGGHFTQMRVTPSLDLASLP
jgi:hypothetical protein